LPPAFRVIALIDWFGIYCAFLQRAAAAIHDALAFTQTAFDPPALVGHGSV
jgi:hypothetical protein